MNKKDNSLHMKTIDRIVNSGIMKLLLDGIVEPGWELCETLARKADRLFVDLAALIMLIPLALFMMALLGVTIVSCLVIMTVIMPVDAVIEALRRNDPN